MQLVDNKNEVRVRIAPSPTGDPHVGTAYVALFNYVFAKKHGGKFILRIEDTDQLRSRKTSEQLISETLHWLGLKWDEGPEIGGPLGPYKQSERLHLYKEYTQQLVDSGHAYYCFCTSERLDTIRAQQMSRGDMPGYDGHCIGLEPEEIRRRIAGGEPHVIRLKMPKEGKTTFKDELRGEIDIDNKQLDDQVLLKSDGFPTYHLANVVDDHLMKITHVIRAEEWISSTPKHVRLYEAFGWQAPQFIHLPLLRNSDRSKISKRKNPVSLTYYQQAGILPQAMLNFLALMGWSFGGDREIFSLNEMIEVFDIKNFSLGGPVFDVTKLNWLNQHYLHQMSESEFVDYLRNELFSQKKLTKLAPLLQKRLSRFDEFVPKGDYFFTSALNYEGLLILPKGKEQSECVQMVKDLAERFDELYDWSVPKIAELLAAHKDALGWKPKDYYMTVRLIMTGRKDSPPLDETIEVLGRDIVRFRLRDYANYLEQLK
jgi:glutamyl-tRNA synthetase